MQSGPYLWVLPTMVMALAGSSSPPPVSSGILSGFIVSPVNQSCFLNDPLPQNTGDSAVAWPQPTVPSFQ